MKKISTLFLIIMCICLAVVLVSCGEHTHDFKTKEPTVLTPATCMYEGQQIRTCECGKTKVEAIPVLPHTYSTEISSDNAFHYYACTAEMCNAFDGLEEHDWVKVKGTKVEPTCVSIGTEDYECSVCGVVKTENIPQLKNHSWKLTETVESTCMKKGSKTYTCELCDKEKVEELDLSSEHSFSKKYTKTDTHHYYVCEVAGCGEIKESSYAEHTWNNGEITTDPTCFSFGVKTYTCEACKATKTEDVPMVDHVFSEEWKDTEAKHYRYCVNDGCDAVDQVGGHVWNNGTVTLAPTANSNGIRTYACVECGRNKTEIVLYHAFEDWSFDADKHYKKCTVEGHTDISEEENHVWDDGVVILDPASPMCGEVLYTCFCGCQHTRPTYEVNLPEGVLNSAAWNEAFAEDKYLNYTISAKWFTDAENYDEFTVKISNEKIQFTDAQGTVYYLADIDANYVYTFDEEASSWTRNEANSIYTAEYFYNFFNQTNEYFEFCLRVKDGAYVTSNDEYSEIAYNFEDGAVKTVSASFNEAKSFKGHEYVGVELSFSSFEATDVILPYYS